MHEKIAFGTYRTGLQDPEHEAALSHALDCGVRTIDTSSNYMYGDAERLIAKVLKKRNRDDFFIISKGGYIQGPNMQRLNEGMHIEELVRYDPSCYHSIHEGFLADQIDRSLERTESRTIDCYLLHNPEYYLMHTIKPGTSDKEAARHREIMQERIARAFLLLEKKVKEGKIKSYGISSNSFAKPVGDPHFLEFKHLIGYAEAAGGKAHHFKAIQLPMNLLERDGEAAAAWAKAEGLEVYINRPLNAFGKEGMIRLADYPACPIDTLLASLQKVENPGLQQLLARLTEVKARFHWAGAVNDMLEYQVRPHITRDLGIRDETLLAALERFLHCYAADVKHTISRENRERIEAAVGETVDGALEDFALAWLLRHPHVDRVLIGMRKRTYVDAVLQLDSYLK